MGLALIEWIDREPHVHPHCRGLYRSSEDSNIKCPIRRLPPNFSRCRPNYYIAGTPKGGTTSLHTYLTEHPKVYPYAIRGRPSDGESFTRLYKTGHRKAFSKHHYLEDLKDDQIVGDATVSRIIEDGYSNFRDYACDQSKIILLLRDPIERCYSYHLMNHRLGVTKVDPYYDDDVHETVQLNSVSEVMERELREFQYKVKKHPEIATKLFDEENPLFNPSMNCLYEGAYVVHLRRLLRTHGGISRDRVRIYWSEEFFANPKDILADAMAFVGVDPSDVDLDDATSAKYNTMKEEEAEAKQWHSVIRGKEQKTPTAYKNEAHLVGFEGVS